VVNGFSRTYKDQDQRQEESKLAALLYEHKPATPLTGAIRLSVRAFLPMPDGKSKRWKADAENFRIRPTKKPDISNLIKQIEDVMNGVFWVDDRQIVEYGHAGKFYGAPARWEIEVEEI